MELIEQSPGFVEVRFGLIEARIGRSYTGTASVCTRERWDSVEAG